MESPPAPTPPTPRQAFTLVELLVVIGIIAVLIGILLPTLNRARRQANDVVCQSNMRQIGVATQNYIVDNRDRMPYTSYGGGSSVVPGALGAGFFRRGFNFSDPANPSVKEVTYGYPAMLYRLGYIKNASPTNSVWLCPAADEGIREYGNTYRWYASTVARDGTSKDRSRYGKAAVWVADNVELAPYPVNVFQDTSFNATLPKPNGEVRQFFPHYTKSIVRMGADATGTRYSPWVDPRRGIPFLSTLFVDGHVSKQVARTTTSGSAFGGFAPIAE